MTNAVNNAIQLSPATVHQHVHGQTKVLDAVRASGILQDPAVAPYATEIVAVLNKLSPAHNRKILNALDEDTDELNEYFHGRAFGLNHCPIPDGRNSLLDRFHSALDPLSVPAPVFAEKSA